MSFPEDFKYTKEHEWVKLEDNIATIGITDHAQEQLGTIVFVELPEDGDEVKKGESIGVVESTKAVSDVFSPVSGVITDVNQPLVDSPETINDDPYEEGWLVKIEMSDSSEIEELMNSEEYGNFVKEEAD